MLVSEAESGFRLFVEEGDEPCSGSGDIGGGGQITEDLFKPAAKFNSGKISRQGKKGSEAETSEYAEFSDQQGDVAGPDEDCGNDKYDQFQPANAYLEGICAASKCRERTATNGAINSAPESKCHDADNCDGHQPAYETVLMR